MTGKGAGKDDKKDKIQEKADGAAENTEGAATVETEAEVSAKEETSVAKAIQTVTKQTVYTPIDVRL